MSETKTKSASSVSWVLIAVVIVFLGGAVYIVWTVLSDDSPRKKANIATITLVKPPPIPVKEKPPEPEPVKESQKKEQIIDPGPQNEAQNANEQDDTPAGDKLGLDADGKAGTDAYGLVAKKGGRALLAGDGGLGRLSLLGKYASYTQIMEAAIRKKVQKYLDENGGVPRGKFQTVVQVSIDGMGKIVQFRIIGSSGNHKMDDAVKESLSQFRINEPPPEGMPRMMNIRVNSQS